MAQKITPCFFSSSRNVVATDTESNTASTATPVSRFRSSSGMPSFSNVSSSLGSTCSRLSSLGRCLGRSEEHTSDPVTQQHLVCRLLLEKKKKKSHKDKQKQIICLHLFKNKQRNRN